VSISIRCPQCRTVAQVSEQRGGDTLPCSGCGVTLRVPQRAPATSSTIPSAPSSTPGNLFPQGSANLFADEATAPGKRQDSENPYQSPTFHEPVIKSTPRKRYGRLDPRTASRGKRFVGAIIDGVLVLVPMLFLLAVVDGAQNEDSIMIMALLAIGVVAIFQAVLVTMYGKSVAKFVLGITIVKDADDQLPGFVHGVLLRMFVPGLISNIPLVGGIFGLVNPLYIFGEEKRCLHDLIAGTKVLDDQLVRAYQQRDEDAAGNRYASTYLS
jgi:uncharacterized RDD family membrane protein YckC